jgi:hypothetical protein
MMIRTNSGGGPGRRGVVSPASRCGGFGRGLPAGGGGGTDGFAAAPTMASGGREVARGRLGKRSLSTLDPSWLGGHFEAAEY